MVSMKAAPKFVLTLLLLSLSLALPAADIRASLDRNPVHLGETFTLSFTASGDVDGDPDFSPLEKLFNILGRNRSSEFSVTNGKMQRSITWSLTLTSRATGTFTIPKIAFGRDHSRPTLITVLEPRTATDVDDDQDVLLETEISDAAPYVQAQTTLTVRVLHAVGISNARLSDVKVSNGDAVIVRLGEDRVYETRRGRRSYQVIERHYALFPQQSGALTVEPLHLQAYKSQPSRKGSLFDDLFQRRMGARIELASRPIELAVKAIPSSYPAGQWLPAQGLELRQRWSTEPPRFRLGEPLTRTLQLSVKGQTSAQLPILGGKPGPDWKVYPDQPAVKQQADGDLIVSERTEKLALIPTRAGKLMLPGITLHWWNTRSDRLETASIPAREVTVLPATPQAPPATSPQTRPAIATSTPAAPRQAAVPTWIWVLMTLLASGWLLTALAWWRSRDPARHGRTTAEPKLKQAQQRLRLACRRNDPQAAHAALLAWAKCRWPQARPATLGRLRSRLPAELDREIALLERCLYAPGGGEWRGDALWRAWQSSRDELGDVGATPGKTGLEPLFRHVGAEP